MKRGRLVLAVLGLCCVSAMGLAPAPASAQSAPESAEALFIDAQKSLARGDFESAEKLLTEALARDPLFVSAVWQLAQISESRGELHRAREWFARGLAIDPDAAWAREKLAKVEARAADALLAESRCSIEAADWRAAAAKITSYLRMRPADADALAAMARCQLALGNRQAAREYLDRARSINPAAHEIASLSREIDRREHQALIERLVARAERALADSGTGARESARAALEAVLAADPENMWAIREIGRFEEQTEAPLRADSVPAQSLPAAHFIPDSILPEPPVAAPGRADFTSLLGRISLLIILSLSGAIGCVALRMRRRCADRRFPLQGSMSLAPVLDVVALLNANAQTGLLVIESESGSGELYFEKGEIIHARCGRLIGKPAARRLFEARTGRFHFRNRLPAVRRSINDPLGLLLLSAKPERVGERTPVDRPKTRVPVAGRH